MKPPFFLGSITEKDYKFIVDYHKRLHKMDTIDQHGVELVTFKLYGDSTQWQRDYIESSSSLLPSLTQTLFHTLYLEKYVLCTFCDKNKDEFFTLKWGNMTITDYEANFHALSKYAIQLHNTKEERIHLYVKGLNNDM